MSTNANTSGTGARSPVAAVSREDEVAPMDGAGIELSESPSSSPSSDAESVLPASVAPEGEPGAEDTSAFAGCKSWMQDHDWLRREVRRFVPSKNQRLCGSQTLGCDGSQSFLPPMEN